MIRSLFLCAYLLVGFLAVQAACNAQTLMFDNVLEDHFDSDLSSPGLATTYGYTFHVSTPQRVDALGLLDVGTPAGVSMMPEPVMLWRNDGTLLAQTAGDLPIQSITGAFDGDRWLFESLAQPVILQPGTYAIGFADLNPSFVAHMRSGVPVLLTAPGIAFGETRIDVTGDYAGFPGDTPAFPPSNGWFGANLLVTQIPEPASLLLIGTGGVLLMSRRRGR